jgi:hypothetical protein
MIWVDGVFGRGFTRAGGLNLGMLGLAVTMTVSQAVKLHLVGTIAAGILTIMDQVLRGWGFIV